MQMVASYCCSFLRHTIIADFLAHIFLGCHAYELWKVADPAVRSDELTTACLIDSNL